MKLSRGTRLVAYPTNRLADQIFLEVTRKARDGSWVDVRCFTWAVTWTCRVPAHALMRTAVIRPWDADDVMAQERDFDRKRSDEA